VTGVLAATGLPVLAVAATGWCAWHCVRGLRRGGHATPLSHPVARPDEVRQARADLDALTLEMSDHNTADRPGMADQPGAAGRSDNGAPAGHGVPS
jgi:hypothetical protein